ncbi:unnamed protein product [Phytophthora lilii]|uniref:Unnamed protein product n=1 Tax=Phytophthora lilii TaxID=2077276 RepID=A0A9W6TE38_9STRA|nr:unnamed protein product [Phytophthora lilii]
MRVLAPPLGPLPVTTAPYTTVASSRIPLKGLRAVAGASSSTEKEECADTMLMGRPRRMLTLGDWLDSPSSDEPNQERMQAAKPSDAILVMVGVMPEPAEDRLQIGGKAALHFQAQHLACIRNGKKTSSMFMVANSSCWTKTSVKMSRPKKICSALTRTYPPRKQWRHSGKQTFSSAEALRGCMAARGKIVKEG